MACRRDHSRIASILEDLPTDQGGRWRHKCAGCAYEAGYEAGYNHVSEDIDEVLDSLDESQAGSQRHKDAYAAYTKGQADGVRDRTNHDNGIY